MDKLLRLGISASAFAWVMPEGLSWVAYGQRVQERSVRFDDRQNDLMVEFYHQLMKSVDRPEVEALEFYHSISFDRDRVIGVVHEYPGVNIWSMHAPFGRFADPSGPDDEVRAGARAALLDSVEAALMLGAKVIVVHPSSNVAYDVPRKRKIDCCVELLKEIGDAAGEKGLKLAVEPMFRPNEIGHTLDELMGMIERVDRPNVGINFDVNHVFGAEDIPDLIRQAGSLIYNVHMCDQDGVERHWLPFEGTLDYNKVLAAIVEVGFTGPIIYESHMEESKNCDHAMQAIVENYKRLIKLSPKKSR